METMSTPQFRALLAAILLMRQQGNIDARSIESALSSAKALIEAAGRM
jgi:hypothetical protein